MFCRRSRTTDFNKGVQKKRRSKFSTKKESKINVKNKKIYWEKNTTHFYLSFFPNNTTSFLSFRVVGWCHMRLRSPVGSTTTRFVKTSSSRGMVANAIEVQLRCCAAFGGVDLYDLGRTPGLKKTTLRRQKQKTWTTTTPSPSSRCVSQHTREWLAKRKKVVKRTLTEAKRTQLRELFAALDSDGGGEVEFEEFASAWKMMAGDREESVTIARKAFKEIDADGNGTMDFEEFSRLMLDLE